MSDSTIELKIGDKTFVIEKPLKTDDGGFANDPTFDYLRAWVGMMNATNPQFTDEELLRIYDNFRGDNLGIKAREVLRSRVRGCSNCMYMVEHEDKWGGCCGACGRSVSVLTRLL